MIREFTNRLSFRIIYGTVSVLLLFGIIQSFVGYSLFTQSLTNEYNESAFRTAETAAVLVDGNQVDDYLTSLGQSEQYRVAHERLDIFCQKQDVTLIYVIKPDTDDYGEFTSVINVCNRNSDYDEWEVGYRRETTNDEYREVYRQIYEEGLERGTVLRTKNLNSKEAHITSLVPVKNDSGEVKAILCVQRPMKELATVRHRFMIMIAVATVLLALASSLSAYYFLKKDFVRPVNTVIKEAERFAKESTEAQAGTLEGISTITEIDTLARSIGQMEKDTLLHIKCITEVTAENKRIGTELSIASSIQAAVLPNEFPAFPDRKDFEIFASMTPAKEVGGDFYDFFLIDDDHLALVIADVSGKGVPAALFMMIAKLLIKLRANSGGTPAQMLFDVNNTLCEKNKMDLFVTVWLAIITLSTGEGCAVNAGHEHPAFRKADGKYTLLKYRHGIPLATLQDFNFNEHDFSLSKGDSILVYTDGVTEATNKDNEMFGEKRLLEALAVNPDASPEECIENVMRSIDEFIEGAEQFDDITMLALRYNGN